MKTVVKTGVQTVDINRLRQEGIYLSLFNKYKALLQNKKYYERIRIINKCREEQEYSQLTDENQLRLFCDLQIIERRNK